MVKIYVGHMAPTGLLPNLVENRQNGHVKLVKQAKKAKNVFFGLLDLYETCFVPDRLTNF